MTLPPRRRRLVAPLSLVVALGLGLTTLAGGPAASAAPAAAAAPPAPSAAPGNLGRPSKVTVGGVSLENSFVSSLGWVKPDAGQPEQDGTYPSRLLLTNTNPAPTAATVDLTAPAGSVILSASGPGSSTVAPGGGSLTWTVPVPGAAAGDPGRATLVLRQQADSLAETPTLVWRDLSTSATLTVGATTSSVASSHGPKVIPPGETYDTARYGDRPFPVVPVQYTDRDYQATHSGDSLASVINDPANPGSTFNLYQEMSLGQLYPEGTVPSAGIASADFAYPPGFDFSRRAVPGNTCAGTTLAGTEAVPTQPPYGTPLYPERITDGVYNLPGDTGYYGSDSNGSALIGAVGGVGALQNIDSGCGDTGKLVHDAAALADPEIDYSDYDTDKDGVVDFFMAVFAGCGGNGASQLTVAGCDYPGAPYDNVWPHSSSLENGYVDPVTGLPGYTTDDQLKDLEGRPLWYTDTSYDITKVTTTPGPDSLKVLVRVGPYNVNPETAIDFASVISHEYGHSLGLPDFYSTGSRETYGSWTLMAEDRSQNIDAFGRQELGWVVPAVLPKTGSVDVEGWTDSKQDTDTISWRRPDGTPYTLTEGQGGVGRVQNSQMYVAKLPGRRLLDATAFDTGGSPSHLWWSGSGNAFGCTPQGGHNIDLAVPELASLGDDAEVRLSFQSRWDVEWDFDYGYVLTTTDGGRTYTSHPSENGYTTSNTDPAAANPNNVACQATYDNGITGSSGSYQAGTEAVDRKAGSYPAPVFVEDSYDISDLAGAGEGALRFSYATDPGLARPGWFIDDVKVTVDPDGAGPLPAHPAFVSDFETSGGPTDPSVFNGGCREDLTTAQKCTSGWTYLKAGAESAQDHAYYLELRDRSGFDFDGHGEADRGPATFGPGLYLSYTDEAHGYGNVGTDDPPAQSPLDSVPQPGDRTPDLDDAAFTTDPARRTFSDGGAGHVDNYTDPSSPSGNWEFRFGCLGFTVDSLSGTDAAPVGNLTGDVTFTMGSGATSGCGDFDYGYPAPPAGANTAPTARASAGPAQVGIGQPVTLSAQGSTDAETPNNLTYSWDFDNGGSTKDATGPVVTTSYPAAGLRRPSLSVSDPQGLTATASTTVTVTAAGGAGQPGAGPVARIKVKPKQPGLDRKVRFVAKRSTGTGALSYAWNFHNGGKRVDARGVKVKTRYRRVGRHRVTLRVTDSTGAGDKASARFRVRAHSANRASGRVTPEELFRALF